MIIYEEVLREFQRQRVRYVVVGGIAQNLHGSMRATADLDILVEMSNRNLKKIVRILQRQGYGVRQPVDPMGIADADIRKIWIRKKRMKAFNFYKDGELKEVDIIIESPVTYEEARKKANSVHVGSLALPFISIDHLIKMKTGTGRAIDRLDVRELKKIKELRKKR
jgi:glutaredoxin